MGVDNGLGRMAEYLSAELLGDPAAVGQAFADAFCGASPSTTMPGTCGEPVTRSEIELVVELNLDEQCANLTVTDGGVSTSSVHNLGPPTLDDVRCLSGTLGVFPTPLGELGNARLRMTVSAEGLTDGLLGATASGETADAMLDTIRDDARNVGYQVFDARGTPSGDVEDPCDAISGTYRLEAIRR
jgi:hypothetical protein